MKRITIITPSYNQKDYIEETLDSILSQNYGNLEYIVVDGGSDDGSVEIIRKYEKHLAYFISEPDRGQSEAINKGLALANGEWLGWVNSDDCLCSGALNAIDRLSTEVTNPGWIVGATSFIGDASGITYPKIVDYATFLTWPHSWFPQQSTFWNRAMMDRVGVLRVDLHYAMDLDYFMRMFVIEKPVLTDEVLAEYRIHSEAKCIVDRGLALEEAYRVIATMITRLINGQPIVPVDLVQLVQDINELVEAMALDKRKQDRRLKRIIDHKILGSVIKAWSKINPKILAKSNHLSASDE